MATFQMQGTDGKTYQVEAPDIHTAYQTLVSQAAPEKSEIPWSEVPEDVARSGAAGVGKGAIGVAGMPGDLRQLSKGAATWIRGKAGLSTEPPTEIKLPFDIPIPEPETTDELVDRADKFLAPRTLSGVVTGQQPESFLKYQPKSRTGRLAETVGEFSPGFVIGPGGRMVRAATTVGGAGASEAAGQLAEGTPYEPAARTIAGVVGSMAGHRFAVRPTGEDLIRHAVPRDFTAYRKLGPEAMVLDASPATVGLAQGVSVAPGTAKNQIVDALVQRDAGRSNRLIADTQGALGPARDASILKRHLDEVAQRNAGPMYTSAKQNAPELPGNLRDTLNVQLTGEAEKLTKDARVAYLGEFDKLDDALMAGKPELVAERLHNMRKGYDAQIVYDPRAVEALSSADKAKQGVLKDWRKTVDDLLKNRFPGFAEADEVVSTSKRMQDDIDYGQGALEGGKYASTPERFRSDVATRNLPAVGAGMKHDVRVAMGTQSNDLPALRKKVGGENDFNREKLAHVFGQPAVDRLTNAVGREQAFAQHYVDIDRGSQTAQRKAAADAVAGTDPPRITMQETAVGVGLKGLAAVANSLLTRAHVASSQPARDALVRALLTRGPEGEALMRAAQASNPLAGNALRAIASVIASTTDARAGAK